MKKILIVMAFVISGSIICAQDYNASIGVRGGETQGITFKTFVGGSSAFDLILGTHYHGLNFTVLYEIHSFDIFGVDNLALFYGFGGHVGFYNSTYWPWAMEHYASGPVVGVDGVIGVEYTFDEIPINLSLDIVPTFNVVPYFGYWQRGALSIRYVFK
jgi:hypothetical protein